MLRHEPQADEPAPVLAEERDALEPESGQERGRPVHVPLVRVVAPIARLVRPSEPDQVGRDDAMPGVHQRRDHLSIQIRPGGLAVQEQDGRRVLGPFVQVVHAQPVDLDVVGRERVAG